VTKDDLKKNVFTHIPGKKTQTTCGKKCAGKAKDGRKISVGGLFRGEAGLRSRRLEMNNKRTGQG